MQSHQVDLAILVNELHLLMLRMQAAMAAERRRREEQYAAERERQWEQSLAREAEQLK